MSRREAEGQSAEDGQYTSNYAKFSMDGSFAYNNGNECIFDVPSGNNSYYIYWDSTLSYQATGEKSKTPGEDDEILCKTHIALSAYKAGGTDIPIMVDADECSWFSTKLDELELDGEADNLSGEDYHVIWQSDHAQWLLGTEYLFYG